MLALMRKTELTDGQWQHVRSLLSLLDEQGKIGWDKAFLDGSFIAAKKGVPA